MKLDLNSEVLLRPLCLQMLSRISEILAKKSSGRGAGPFGDKGVGGRVHPPRT